MFDCRRVRIIMRIKESKLGTWLTWVLQKWNAISENFLSNKAAHIKYQLCHTEHQMFRQTQWLMTVIQYTVASTIPDAFWPIELHLKLASSTPCVSLSLSFSFWAWARVWEPIAERNRIVHRYPEICFPNSLYPHGKYVLILGSWVYHYPRAASSSRAKRPIFENGWVTILVRPQFIRKWRWYFW